MGLVHPDDLSAWRRERAALAGRGRLSIGLRELAHDPRFELFIGGTSPRLLIALESVAMADRMAVLAPLEHLDLTRVAILAPMGAGAVVPQHPWVTKILFPEELTRYFDSMGAVLATSHHTDVGASAYDFSQAVKAPFFVIQSTVLTPHSAPLAPEGQPLAWTDADATFWQEGSARAHQKATVVGSQLLWSAAQHALPEPDPATATTYLGQLHEPHLGYKQMAKAAEDFCLRHGAVYRPHPAENDRRVRSVHERLVRLGVSLDQSSTPVGRFDGPVVGAYSTGVLEAAARGLPAWVEFPQPPAWLRELWERYRMFQHGGEPTPPPVVTGFEPAYAVGITLDRYL
ncbi:MAG: hypothetical protein ACRCYQ_13020 [Nocardioides sp.]